MPTIPPRVSHPPSRLHVIFDGDCGFCRFWIERWRAETKESTKFDPYQKVASRYPEIPVEAFQEAVQVVDREGRVYSGAVGVFRLLRTSRWRWLSTLAAAVPLFGKIADAAYRFVARHRMIFSKLTRLGWGGVPEPPTFAVARRIFGHGLGLIFLTAFGSLALQWRGLYGSRGISALSAWMGRASAEHGWVAYTRLPSIFWLGHNDPAIAIAIWLGVIISLAMACGIAPGACSLALWALYLSFSSVGEPFLNFQWDLLLLETSLLAAVFLPWSLRPRWNLTTRATTLGRWLLWWLLCRLMLESGVVKLTSGDPTWRDLTALTYHYQTQPLPLWTAWVAHQAPVWLLKLEALATFAIEFVSPFLMFGPRRVRHVAAWSFILLQAAIMSTGNYAFFNLLCILLSLLLIEDSHWPTRWRLRLLGHLRRPEHSSDRSAAVWIFEPLGVLSALLTGLLLVGTFSRTLQFPRWIQTVVEWSQPWRSFNSYGLFASMTTKRPEIIVEGSVDGEHWQAYEFKYKPGDLARRPGLAEPHQPRLDWQMWFAALSDVRREQWFLQFLSRLLENTPEVTTLLAWNPFPETPPRYVRALLYEYKFTRFGEGPNWWKREYAGVYCPPLSLKRADLPTTAPLEP